jgi:hypothetical protein
MGFAWMPEGSRRASANGTVDDDTGWPYGRGGTRTRAAYRGQGSPSGHRTGRHAQAKGRRPVLASLTVGRLQSLSRARGTSEAPAGGTEARGQPDRRMSGRGAHAAAWPAMPPR